MWRICREKGKCEYDVVEEKTSATASHYKEQAQEEEEGIERSHLQTQVPNLNQFSTIHLFNEN